MNLWILKYDQTQFSENYFEKIKQYAKDIPQLQNYRLTNFSKGNFHFFSLESDGTPKKYNKSENQNLFGYSGLLIDKSIEINDLRNIENVDVKNPEKYFGQFSLYSIEEDFHCFVDNFGFHKVFYGKKNGAVYVSNSFEMMKALKVFKPNVNQMLKDFSTIRFGIFPGYNTLLEEVFTLPEYGSLVLSKNGELGLKPYKDITTLLIPDSDFETKLKEAVNDYQIITKYLRKYHQTAIGLSGGFDGRLMVNMFKGTDGKSLETYTYNRAGNLDLYIASHLSKKAKLKHTKFKIRPEVKASELRIAGFKDSAGDPFTMSFKAALKNFYKAGNEFKVVLGGNGGDTDWEFGEKRIADVDKSTLEKFIHDYSKKLTDHPIFNPELKGKFAKEIETYFWDKYKLFADRKNFQQLLASAFFHLERFRGEQGFAYSQNGNKNHDVFAPFAIESFNQLVFLANKKQLDRGLRQGIQYRLSQALTNNEIPYAPILTARNEHGNNWFQKKLNRIAPYLPKIIWKLNNGDTNTRIRKQYQSQVNQLYREFISKNSHSAVFQNLNKDVILEEVEKEEYSGKYNQIGSMIFSIHEIEKP